jgi:hypothetical protein
MTIDARSRSGYKAKSYFWHRWNMTTAQRLKTGGWIAEAFIVAAHMSVRKRGQNVVGSILLALSWWIRSPLSVSLCSVIILRTDA